MSPLLFREKNRRYLFFSQEESRMHVHVLSPDGDAKFWLEPIVSLARSAGYSPKALTQIQRFVEEHQNEIKRRWKNFFKS